jgi:glycosyltransferase involved in cell wall biosynthesis
MPGGGMTKVSPRMRILLASRAYESQNTEGGFVLLKDLARGLAPFEDIEVSVFGQNVRQHGRLRVLRVFSQLEWGLRQQVEFILGLAKHQWKFDILHVAHVPTITNMILLRTLSWLGKFAGVRYVQTVTAVPKIDWQPLGSALLWGDQIVLLTKSLLLRPEKLCVVRPWPHPGRIKFDPVRRESTRKSMFPKFSSIIVFPGEFQRLGVSSDFFKFVEAMLDAIPDSCFVLACRYDEAGIGETIHSFLRPSLLDRVLNVGKVEWISRLLEAADLIVYPARKMEGKFQPPLVLMEALALGRPVFTSLIVEMPEEESGGLVLRASCEDWVEGARHVADWLQTTSTARRCGYEENFRKMVEAYRSIYRVAVGTRSA